MLHILILLCTISAQQQPQSAATLGTIKGVVVDPSGKRIEGATVYAEGDNYPPRSRPATVTTDSNGEFMLDVIPGKDIRVHLYKDSDLYSNVVTVFDVPPNWKFPLIDVAPGQTVEQIFRLPQKAGKLQLRVLDADTKTLVHGIYFQLCREDHPNQTGYCLTGSGPPDFEHSIPAGVGISIKVSSDEHGSSDYQWRYRDPKTGSAYFRAKPGETETITTYVPVPKN